MNTNTQDKQMNIRIIRIFVATLPRTSHSDHQLGGEDWDSGAGHVVTTNTNTNITS